MNIVDKLKSELLSLAESKGLFVKFTQTNKSNNRCVSRVYISKNECVTCNNKNVLKIWEFKQKQNSGTTKNCDRYRIYSEVLEHIRIL